MKLYLLTLAVFLSIDMVWLTTIAKSFYQKQIGYLMTPNVNFLAAFIFYLIFVVGLVFFVISPSLEKKSLMTAILTGALFGLITYATYDLTNLATVKDWPLLVTIVDLIWGTVLAASVSAITYLIATKFGIKL
ncbi:MAG: DUF2177 family protein [Candidatus Pacebacteria bacterium]|nr:DUF2177 family protein [Candidatus Paceibacterota bacterium]